MAYASYRNYEGPGALASANLSSISETPWPVHGAKRERLTTTTSIHERSESMLVAQPRTVTQDRALMLEATSFARKNNNNNKTISVFRRIAGNEALMVELPIYTPIENTC